MDIFIFNRIWIDLNFWRCCQFSHKKGKSYYISYISFHLTLFLYLHSLLVIFQRVFHYRLILLSGWCSQFDLLLCWWLYNVWELKSTDWSFSRSVGCCACSSTSGVTIYTCNLSLSSCALLLHVNSSFILLFNTDVSGIIFILKFLLSN